MLTIKKWLFRTEVDLENCIFCNYIPTASAPYLYQDEHYFVIRDIRSATAVQHLLVITKEHIDNALTVKDPATIRRMQQIGEQVLGGLCEEKGVGKQFRFGFHLPPFNSVDHIHLHCFIEPFAGWKERRVVYGLLLSSVEQVLGRLEGGRSGTE